MMDYIEKINNILQREKDKYEKLEKDIQDLRDKELELQQNIDKNGSKTLSGIMNTSSDKQLLNEITSARIELENEYKQEIESSEGKLIEEVNALIGQHSLAISTRIRKSEDSERMRELIKEAVDIDRKIVKEAKNEFRQSILIKQELINRGYISKKNNSSAYGGEFYTYLHDVPDRIIGYFETGKYRK